MLDHRLGGNRARLTPEQIVAVQARVHGYTPARHLGREGCYGDGQIGTVPDIARMLERDYGVTYQSHMPYRTLMQKCGLSYQRPAKQYRSHSEAKAMDFAEALEKTDRHRPERVGHSHSGRR